MKATITSPMTGQPMVLSREPRTLTFRKEEFPIVYHFYRDTDGAQYTEEFTDEVNLGQLYNQYREKYKLPFPDEIKAIRDKYDLSASKMSEVLGFGANVWRNYEAGEVPSESNARLIQLIHEPKRMRELVELNDHLSEKEKQGMLKTIDALIAKRTPFFDGAEIEGYLLGARHPQKTTGYRRPSLARMTEMIVFFTHVKGPFKTVMNKLLFYADFLHFKRTGYSISGAPYRAIQMGPVPVRFEALFDHVATKDEIDIMQSELTDGTITARFDARKDRLFNKHLFTEDELQTLDDVAKQFAKCTSKQLIDLSHEEEAWKEKEKGHEVMDYTKAFELKAI